MAFTDNRQPMVDIDSWDNQADLPLVSSAGAELCGSDDTSRPDLYLSYLNTFYRFCALTSGWQILCPNHFTNVTRSALKFSKKQGYRGNCLGATINTIDMTGLNTDIFIGKKIKICAGLGIGQERTITDVSDEIYGDRGLATTASANSITDTTKRWKINQFIGWEVHLVQNTGVTQARKVLYNDTNTLYFYDANYQQLDSWQNNPFSAISPYAIPNATAGTQAHYTISKHTVTVDSNWTITPDTTSSYVVEGGGVWNFGAFATTPFSNFAFYDVLGDTYTYKTAALSLLLAAIGTDYCLEKLWDYKAFVSGHTVTSFSGRVFTVPAATTPWTRNQWKNYNVKIASGTGSGQQRRIIANSSTSITVDRAFDTTPDATSVLDIRADYETIFLAGGTFSILGKYDYDKDFWSPSNYFDFGTARNGGILFGGQEAYGITSITRNTGGITAVAAAPTAAGSGYKIGDVLTVSTGGTNGKVIVETIASNGAVNTVSLFAAGLTYTTGTGKATTGGTGTGCTINITSIGTVGRVVVATNVNLAQGDAITFSGATEAAWNGTNTVLAIDSLTGFDITTTATANFTASNSQSTTVLVDSTKNWTANEHIGRLVCIATAGYNGTVQWRKITANTATTLTVATIVAAGNGTSRYFITDMKPFGKAKQTMLANQSEEGYATGGSTTTLVDSTKNWIPGSRIGYKFKVVSGTGFANATGEIAITANTETTLTFSSAGFTPDTTTEYQIMDTYGIGTGTFATTTIADSTKNRAVNQWAGMKVRFTTGTGVNQESVIASNTATTLTFGAVTTAPDATTCYAILESNSSTATGRGLATELVWDFYNNNGRYMYAFRGGNTNIIDRYDITTEKFDVIHFNGYGQTEFFTTGTQYCFDGKNRIYINPSNTQRILYYDITANKIAPYTQFPETHGTAIIGNKMEIVSGTNGEKFLYLNRNSTINFYRILLPTY